MHVVCVSCYFEIVIVNHVTPGQSKDFTYLDLISLNLSNDNKINCYSIVVYIVYVL